MSRTNLTYSNIPDEIKQLQQWVVAKQESKVPYMTDSDKPASSVDPSTWSDFLTAKEAVESGRYDYTGFVFNDNGIVGIDIDNGYDEDGFINPDAIDIIKKCGSYTEKSRSGRGFHILVKGDLPFKGKNNLSGVEIYKAARYFIMTGDVVHYNQIIENQEAIDYIVDVYFHECRTPSRNDNFGRDRVYNPVWDSPIDGDRIKIRPVYPRIPTGARNICLTSLAGMLHNIGYNKAQIFDELKYANFVACDPPLDKQEVHTICESVTKYKR